MDLKDQVLDALHKAFDPSVITPDLKVRDGHVFGSVEVKESVIFDDLDDIRRQKLFWDQLRAKLGVEALAIGPVVLEPRNTWRYTRD